MRSLTPLGQFCQSYLASGAEVAEWGKYFVIAALAAALILALIEAWKRFEAPPPALADDTGRSVTGLPIKDLAEALRELVTALAAAPVWLALLAVGVFVFWVPGNTIPAKCEAAATYENWPAPPSRTSRAAADNS